MPSLKPFVFTRPQTVFNRLYIEWHLLVLFRKVSELRPCVKVLSPEDHSHQWNAVLFNVYNYICALCGMLDIFMISCNVVLNQK